MQDKKENPWEIDIIDKMFVFSDINNSSKFSSKTFGWTFRLASLSIHTSVQIYSERIDALYNFTLGFLNGLKHDESKKTHASSYEKIFVEKKNRKGRIKPFLLTWKNSDSKEKIFVREKPKKEFSSAELFPQKNYLSKLRSERLFLARLKKYCDGLFLPRKLVVPGKKINILEAGIEISIGITEKRLQILADRFWLAKEFRFSSLIPKKKEKEFNQKTPQPEYAPNQITLSRFQFFSGLENIPLIESLGERKNGIKNPKSERNKKDKKFPGRKKTKNTKICWAQFLFLKKSKLKFPGKQFLSEKNSSKGENKFLRIPNWKFGTKVKKNFLDLDKGMGLADRRLNFSPKNRISKKWEEDYRFQRKKFFLLSNSKTFFSKGGGENLNEDSKRVFSEIKFSPFLGSHFTPFRLKKGLEKCCFKLSILDLKSLLLKKDHHLEFGNFTKFILFFLQKASEKKMVFFSDLFLKTIYFISHNWVYSSNGRVSA